MAGGYDLEEIRARADLVEIISPHVALRKAGRRLTGLCPFHKERTPSFTVDPENGLWHCFGCKAGGDLFRFVEMIEKVSFSEAVEMLARRYGVAETGRPEGAGAARRERLLSLHGEAARYFQHCLRAPAAQPARDYLARRGLSEQTIKEWGIGYAPPTWDALLKAMGRRGYAAEELARAGLAVAREGGEHQGHYDRFRDRLIFPIWDPGGRVIAFGGRAMSDDQQPKYLNSPETPIFQKGRTLYGLHRARRAMGEASRAVVVEGYLDVIACHEAGFPETVGTMGTALTSEHVDLLRRRVPRLVLSFDPDSAGLAAALRSRELFLQAGLEVLVVTLPEGFDPDRLVRERGGEAFRGLVEAAQPILEWEIGRDVSAAGARGPREALKVLREAAARLARIPLDQAHDYYLNWLANRAVPYLGSEAARARFEAELRLVLDRERRKLAASRAGARLSAAEKQALRDEPLEGPAGDRLGRSLLAAFLHQPDLAERFLAELEVEDFSSPEQRSVFSALARLVQEGEQVTAQAALGRLDAEARPLLAELAVAEVPEERLEEEVRRAIRRLAEARLRRQEADLRRQLEAASSDAERQALLERLSECRRRRSRLAEERIVGES